MKRLCAVLALAATQADADAPAWTGIWAAEPEWCRFADQIGSHNPAPIEITAGQINGLENSCEITGVTGNDGYRFWEIEMRCTSEGSTYAETTLLMLSGNDTLWRWYGAGEPIRFARCKEKI